MSLPRVLSSAALAAAVAVPAFSQTALTVQRVAGGLRRPTYVTSPPRDYDRLFVLEKDVGQIRIVKDGKLLARPFLDIRTKIRGGGERGLLGLAFHPGYARNGYFYVNYTRAADGATVVERYTVSRNDPDLADPSSGFVLLTVPQPFSNHNGGCLQFGPRDGYLYIGLGDGGSGGDPFCNAQKGSTLLGKILRIDVDGGTPYAIPKDNPFVKNSAFRNEIWTYGWRNPWRFSFDRATGDMYVGDVGQNSWEEISFQAHGKGGGNYGWKVMEGAHCFSTGGCPGGTPRCNDPRLILPIHEYRNSIFTGNRSVTGGYVYRGCAIPDLVGTYFFADYVSGRIWSFRYVNGKVTAFRDRSAELGGPIGNISSFGEDADGELYIVEYGASSSIFKIVAKAPPPAVDLGYGNPGQSGRTPRFEACGLLTRGNRARFRVRNAPANTTGVLALSSRRNPTRYFFGTLVPALPLEVLPFSTDTNGEWSFVVPGGGGPGSAYGQAAVIDGNSLGLSNALRIDLQP